MFILSVRVVCTQGTDGLREGIGSKRKRDHHQAEAEERADGDTKAGNARPSESGNYAV